MLLSAGKARKGEQGFAEEAVFAWLIVGISIGFLCYRLWLGWQVHNGELSAAEAVMRYPWPR